MSSWWAGYSGSGLVLNQIEFEKFLEEYKQWNYIEEGENLFEDTSVDDFIFIRSAHAGMYEYGREIMPQDGFWITAVMQGDCDGMRFIPYMNQRKKNLFMIDDVKNPDYVDCDMCGENAYVIYSDKALDSIFAFEKKPYVSYEAFKEEFKEKMERYLPEDFEWDNHLGRFSYAAYA